MNTPPFPIRKVINLAKLLERGGMPHRRAIAFSLHNVKASLRATKRTRRRMSAETQESLTHRARSMRAWRMPA